MPHSCSHSTTCEGPLRPSCCPGDSCSYPAAHEEFLQPSCGPGALAAILLPMRGSCSHLATRGALLQPFCCPGGSCSHFLPWRGSCSHFLPWRDSCSHSAAREALADILPLGLLGGSCRYFAAQGARAVILLLVGLLQPSCRLGELVQSSYCLSAGGTCSFAVPAPCSGTL